MSRDGASSRAAPVGWVHLKGGYTLRWRRGDHVAHVLRSEQTDDHGMSSVVDTIPVSPSGWTDFAETARSGNGGGDSTATSGAHNRRQPAQTRRGKAGDDSVR